MATKAELEAELFKLRAQMADRESGKAQTDPAPKARQPAPEAGDAPAPEWGDVLRAQGIDPGDATALLDQLTEELGDLPRNKPLLTAITAFGIGFVLGRLSK